MTKETFIVASAPAAVEDGSSNSHRPLVHLVDPDAESGYSPVITCCADTGLADDWAALACSLGTMHTEVSGPFLQMLYEAEDNPELLELRNRLLQKDRELIELRLKDIEGRIKAVKMLSRRVAGVVKLGGQWRTAMQQISEHHADLLEMAGMQWDSRGTLQGWFAFVQFALEHWQQERATLYKQLQSLLQEQENLSWQVDFVNTIAIGAQQLLGHMQNKVPGTSGMALTMRHLRGHTKRPLSRNWFWMIDSEGVFEEELLLADEQLPRWPPQTAPLLTSQTDPGRSG